MKRLFVYLFSCMVFIQLPARVLHELFTEAPYHVFPTLSPESRMDLVDFMKSGMDACSKSVFNDTVRMAKMSDIYIKLQMSPVSETELLLLVRKQDTLVCLVKTCHAGNKESTVDFYRMPDWEQIDTRHFLTMPAVDDFFIKNSSKNRLEQLTALESLNLPMISATIDEKDSSLHFQLQADGGFSDIRELAQPFLEKEIIYRWNGKRFSK